MKQKPLILLVPFTSCLLKIQKPLVLTNQQARCPNYYKNNNKKEQPFKKRGWYFNTEHETSHYQRIVAIVAKLSSLCSGDCFGVRKILNHKVWFQVRLCSDVPSKTFSLWRGVRRKHDTSSLYYILLFIFWIFIYSQVRLLMIQRPCGWMRISRLLFIIIVRFCLYISTLGWSKSTEIQFIPKIIGVFLVLKRRKKTTPA